MRGLRIQSEAKWGEDEEEKEEETSEEKGVLEIPDEVLKNEKVREVVKKKASYLKILGILKKKFPQLTYEELEEMAIEFYLTVHKYQYEEEARRLYAIKTLHKGARYMQGYLKQYKTEVEVREDRYPLELIFKVYY